MLHRSWLLLPPLIFAACGGDTAGALGQSSVRRECDPGDAVCLATALAPLAEGATLALDVSAILSGSSATDLHFESGAPEVIAIDGERLIGKAAGVAPIMFVNGEGIVLDFVHLFVAQPTSIALHRLTDDGEDVAELTERIQLLAGESMGVSASLRLRKQTLSGEATIRWELDPAVAVLLEDGVEGHRRILARAPGVTTLKAHALGLEVSLPIEVLQ
jgi:hypothetical protein